MKIKIKGNTKLRIWDKQTRKDVTESLNACLHHSGNFLIQLCADGTWKRLEKDKYDILLLEEV